MGSIWGQQDPGGPHVGPMNFVIWDNQPYNDILCYGRWTRLRQICVGEVLPSFDDHLKRPGADSKI